MAEKEFHIDVNLNDNQLKQSRLESLPGDPTGPDSKIWYNSLLLRASIIANSIVQRFAFLSDLIVQIYEVRARNVVTDIAVNATAQIIAYTGDVQSSTIHVTPNGANDEFTLNTSGKYLIRYGFGGIATASGRVSLRGVIQEGTGTFTDIDSSVCRPWSNTNGGDDAASSSEKSFLLNVTAPLTIRVQVSASGGTYNIYAEENNLSIQYLGT